MIRTITRLNSLFSFLAKCHTLLPLVARFSFAAVLFVYFWRSAMTKLGDGVFGLFSPSAGAYAQIFPKVMEQVSYDTSQMTAFHTMVVLFGTWAEFILPVLILVGLFTRPAALGMIGFIAVQTLTDLYGHGLIQHSKSVGAWFDNAPDALVMDQRLLWLMPLLILITYGGGPLSLDRVAERQS